MKQSFYLATGMLCSFFIAVFAIAFALNRYFPMLVIAGESSVGTWMSGALLMICATLCLVLGMREGWWPWTLITVFFLLALDERFMFHEHLKELIIFSHPETKLALWIYELPVISGALVGVIVVVILWRYLHGAARILLVIATALGTASVVIDVLAAGVFWEECSKLIGELSVVFALLTRTGNR
jgi:hypothetical protein